MDIETIIMTTFPMASVAGIKPELTPEGHWLCVPPNGDVSLPVVTFWAQIT